MTTYGLNLPDKCVEPHREKWVLQHRPRKWNQTPQKRAKSCQKERFLDFKESLKAIFRGEKVGVCRLCSEKSGCYNTISAFAKPPTPAVAPPFTSLENKGSFDFKPRSFTVKILRYTVIAVLLVALGVGLMQVAQYVGDRTTGPHHFAVNPQSSQIPR